MTDRQKEQLHKMRLAGKTYEEISSSLNMKSSSVRTYCSRHGLTDEKLASDETDSPQGLCPNCGKPIEQVPKQKPRRFCSDQCRLDWWSRNRRRMKRNTYYKMKCAFCGKEFLSYGNKNRKYCCHRCYIAARFSDDGVPRKSEAI